MKPDYTTSRQRNFNPVDQLSELPVHLLHCILSFLDRKEAYKTIILSKRWGLVSATSPVLHFSYRDFEHMLKQRFSLKRMMEYVDTTKQRYSRKRMMEYVDTTMQRYSREGLRITKLTLELPVTDLQLCCNAVELACKVDEWLKIAVDNQVVELKLEGPPKYKLPGILFAAKSLKSLECNHVDLPYYEAMDLASIENLHLGSSVFIEDAMLNHIINSCLLLKTLGFTHCFGFNNMVIPASSKLETLDLEFLNPMKLIVETSSLTRFKYFPRCRTRLKYGLDDECWPVISKASLLLNLRILEICYSNITDTVVDELLFELTLLETLKFRNCYDLTTIKVSCTRLKEINLDRCDELLDIKIDAPSLRKFGYCGYFKLSLSVNSQANCDVSLHLIRPLRRPRDFGNGEFLVLKKLLTGISSCNVLKIVMSNFQDSLGPLEFQFDEEELNNIHPGPPCCVRELKLKLNLNLLLWRCSESSITALLDGLFWICHPDVISLHGVLGPSKETIESMICELKRMAESRSHPLKWVEAEGANCSKLPDEGKFDEQLRLHW